LNGLPNRGLIIDLRDNPGGFIWAAERLLQLLTPNAITPTKFALRATPLTAALAAARFNQEELGPWADSIRNAPATGEPYSVHLPITPVELCNDLGQRYGGPIVVVTDANTYSSGDLFTAGIVDNRIGPVVCVGEATGAGGANVWASDDVGAAMEAAGISLPALAKGANFTLSMRRAVRSGDADGVLIEDTGIAGQPYAMTYRDIFEGNADLIEHCGAILAAQPWTQLDVIRRTGKLAITTAGLDHLDIAGDGHPICPGVPIKRDGTIEIKLSDKAAVVDVVGFADGVVRQRRRLARLPQRR
jgi:Peptidase family S41